MPNKNKDYINYTDEELHSLYIRQMNEVEHSTRVLSLIRLEKRFRSDS